MPFQVNVGLDWDDGLAKEITKAVQKSTLEAAELVSETAKRLAPVDSGKLRDSIRALKSKFLNGGAIVISGDKDAYYAHMVEYGTIKQSAKPHLRPALEINKQRTVSIVRKAVEDATR